MIRCIVDFHLVFDRRDVCVLLSGFEERAVRGGVLSVASVLVSRGQGRCVGFLGMKERRQAQLFRKAWILLWKDSVFKPTIDVHDELDLAQQAERREA